MGVSRTVAAMAMGFRLEVEGDVAQDSLGTVMDHVEADLRWVDEVFSTYREDSWISRLSQGKARVVDAPPAVAEVLDLCERFRDETGGAFNARTPEGGIDPTGIVKTWAMERSRWRFGLLGATGWLWGCAGDVVAHGRGPTSGAWRVGIADPREAEGAQDLNAPKIATTTLDERASALATSGLTHRSGHIWNPATGAPAAHFSQVSVRGSDLIACDAWATAIVAGGKRTMKLAAESGIGALALRTLEGRVHAQNTPMWDPTHE